MPWPHFEIVKDNMACPCGCGFGSKESDFDELLMENLEHLRGMWAKPMHLNSVARCASYNEHVGGEHDSAHLADSEGKCRAADVSLITGSYDRKQFIMDATEAGFKRIGIAKTFVHIDVAAESGSPKLPEGWWTYGDARG